MGKSEAIKGITIGQGSSFDYLKEIANKTVNELVNKNQLRPEFSENKFLLCEVIKKLYTPKNV